MPINIYAVKWLDNVAVGVHVFSKPSVGEKGFYRDTVSYSAFSDRERNKWFDKHSSRKKTGVSFHLYREDDYKLGRMSLFDNNKHLPHYTHVDVWAFYKAIGYDYKRQKYVQVKQVDVYSGTNHNEGV